MFKPALNVINSKAKDSNAKFGKCVVGNDKYIAVSAPNEYQSTSNDNSGAVFIYNGSTGQFVKRIDNPNYSSSSTMHAEFGYVMAMNNSFLAISSLGSYPSTVSPYPLVSNCGTVYIYDAETFNLVRIIDNYYVDGNGRISTVHQDTYFGHSLHFYKEDRLALGHKYADHYVRMYNVSTGSYLGSRYNTLYVWSGAASRPNMKYGEGLDSDDERIYIGAPGFGFSSSLSSGFIESVNAESLAVDKPFMNAGYGGGGVNDRTNSFIGKSMYVGTNFLGSMIYNLNRTYTAGAQNGAIGIQQTSIWTSYPFSSSALILPQTLRMPETNTDNSVTGLSGQHLRRSPLIQEGHFVLAVTQPAENYLMYVTTKNIVSSFTALPFEGGFNAPYAGAFDSVSLSNNKFIARSGNRAYVGLSEQEKTIVYEAPYDGLLPVTDLPVVMTGSLKTLNIGHVLSHAGVYVGFTTDNPSNDPHVYVSDSPEFETYTKVNITVPSGFTNWSGVASWWSESAVGGGNLLCQIDVTEDATGASGYIGLVVNLSSLIQSPVYIFTRDYGDYNYGWSISISDKYVAWAAYVEARDEAGYIHSEDVLVYSLSTGELVRTFIAESIDPYLEPWNSEGWTASTALFKDTLYVGHPKTYSDAYGKNDSRFATVDILTGAVTYLNPPAKSVYFSAAYGEHTLVVGDELFVSNINVNSLNHTSEVGPLIGFFELYVYNTGTGALKTVYKFDQDMLASSEADNTYVKVSDKYIVVTFREYTSYNTYKYHYVYNRYTHEQFKIEPPFGIHADYPEPAVNGITTPNKNQNNFSNFPALPTNDAVYVIDTIEDDWWFRYTNFNAVDQRFWRRLQEANQNY